MARPKKIENLSPAEIKAQKANLQQLLKEAQTISKGHTKALKESAIGFESAQREATKDVEAAQRAADKAIKIAAKAHAIEVKRRTKALEAAAKGIEKMGSQLAVLEGVATAE